MPIIPQILTAPYDNLESILNLARVRVNDAIASLSGEILTDTQPFTLEMVNAAWRTLQEFLANLGYTRSKKEIVLAAIPSVTSSDPGSQVSLNWSSYYNGSGYDIPPTAPVLPQDLILPLRLWERQTSLTGTFVPMTQALDGLPDYPKLPWNHFWEWREDAIYMPGATIAVDIRLRYAAYLPDFIASATTPFASQVVPIMRCKNAFAYYIAAEVTGPRADPDAPTFTAAAEQAARLIFNREVAQKQRTTATRRPYGRRHNTFGTL